jgi:hypothetical protein
MCFRLLAAVRSPDGAMLEHIAYENGLDVRVRTQGPLGFVEVAWGDCACSLYTGRRGRERVGGFLRALVEKGLEVQLLLFEDGDALEPVDKPPLPVALEAVEKEGLAALPLREVAALYSGSSMNAGR